MLCCLRITYEGMHTPYLHETRTNEWWSKKKKQLNIQNKIGSLNGKFLGRDTWKVDWMTYRLGYILQRSCWPSLVRICCTIKSTAMWLSPPRGIMISAYFFVGRIKSSKAGFTNCEYCIKVIIRIIEEICCKQLIPNAWEWNKDKNR